MCTVTNRRCCESRRCTGVECTGPRPARALATSATRAPEAEAARPIDSALARVVIQSVRGLSRLSVTAVSGRRDRPGRATRAPVVVVPEGRPVRGGVEQHLADVDGLAAVDQDLVALGQQRDAAVLEALDEVALPQRTAPVERPGRDARDELAQLVHRSRARQRGASYVVAEVEALVVHPGRVGQPPRHQLQALPVARDEGDPVGDQLHEPVVVEAGLPRVEDLHRRVVHGRRGGLCGQDGQVPRPEPLAHLMPSRRRSCPAWDSGRGSDPAGAVAAACPCSCRRRSLVSGRVVTRLAPLVLVLAASLSACGGDGDTDPPATDQSASSSPSDSPPTPRPTRGPAARTAASLSP